VRACRAWAMVSSSFGMPDGRIVLADRGADEIRVLDAFGTHLATRGGKGEGPGEFAALGDIAPWPGDSILAWDLADLGMSVFDRDGNNWRTFFLLSGLDDPNIGPVPVATRADGTILSVDQLWFGVHGMKPTGPVTADSVLVEVWDREGGRLN